MSIFGKQAGLQSEEVAFRGGKVTVHEIMDDDYFECVSLPMQDEDLPDDDDHESMMRYNRAFNLRLMAVSLKQSLNLEADDIVAALKKETREATDLLMAATLKVNGMALAKNSPTTSSEKD